MFISNQEVLRRVGVHDIKLMLVGNRLRWLGHVCRMEDDRPVKELLYGQIFNGSRSAGRPYLRYKDACKNTIRYRHALDLWMAVVDKR